MYPKIAGQDGLIARLVHIALVQHVPGDGLPAHPPGQSGGAAVGLHIHKVAPPANKLADEQPVDTQVGKGQKADLFHMTEEEQHHQGGQDGPVDGQTAVAVAEDGPPVQAAVRPAVEPQIKNDVIGPDGHKGHGDGTDHHVGDLVLGDAEALAPLAAQEHGQQQAAGNDDAIPIDGTAQQGKGHPVQGKGQSQAGERDGVDHFSSPLGRMTARAVRSGVTHRAMRSWASCRVMAANRSAKRR